MACGSVRSPFGIVMAIKGRSISVADKPIFLGAALAAIGTRARNATPNLAAATIVTGALPAPRGAHTGVGSFIHERTR